MNLKTKQNKTRNKIKTQAIPVPRGTACEELDDSREQLAGVFTYCYIANYPQIQWLEVSICLWSYGSGIQGGFSGDNFSVFHLGRSAGAGGSKMTALSRLGPWCWLSAGDSRRLYIAWFSSHGPSAFRISLSFSRRTAWLLSMAESCFRESRSYKATSRPENHFHLILVVSQNKSCGQSRLRGREISISW